MINIFNDYIFSPIGFIISIITLFTTLNVKKKVNEALTVKELRNELSNYMKEFKKYSNLINNRSLPDNKAMDFRQFLVKLDTYYSSIHKDISKYTSSCIKLLADKDKINYEELTMQVAALQTIIEREGKK